MTPRSASRTVRAGLLAVAGAAAVLAPALPAAATSSCTVPYVINDPVVAAVQEISEAGLIPVVSGPTTGAYVHIQSPGPFHVVACSTRVNLRTVAGPTP